MKTRVSAKVDGDDPTLREPEGLGDQSLQGVDSHRWALVRKPTFAVVMARRLTTDDARDRRGWIVLKKSKNRGALDFVENRFLPKSGFRR
jgi:hypothetical protein